MLRLYSKLKTVTLPFYQKGEKRVNLMHRLGAYRERSDRYLRAFREYIKDSKIVLDVGCGKRNFYKISH